MSIVSRWNGDIKLSVRGNPIPYKERAAVRGNKVHSYRPDDLKAWQSNVAGEAMERYGINPTGDMYSLDLHFYMKPPKKSVYQCPRGDCDNLAKAVQDALQGIVWLDDRQVVKLTVEKEWLYDSDDYGVEIRIHVLNEASQ